MSSSPDAAVTKTLLLLTAAGQRAAARADLLDMFAGKAAVWEALPPGVLGKSPQGEGGDGSPSFDFAVEVVGDDALAILGDMPLPGSIDPGRSTAVVGTEHHIMPGDREVALFCSLRRKTHLSGMQFRDYWLNRHADHGRRNAANRYRQLHPVTGPQDRIREALGLADLKIDGVAEAYFTDVESLRARLNSPDIAGDAFEDEQRFIDHSRSAFAPFERLR